MLNPTIDHVIRQCQMVLRTTPITAGRWVCTHEDEIATEDTEDAEKTAYVGRILGVFGVFSGHFALGMKP
jgi:hypothetical protein